MKNKNSLIILVITVLVGIVFITYASYAYITANVTGTSDYLNMSMNLYGSAFITFNAQRGSNVSLTIDGVNMLEDSIDNNTPIAESTGKINVVASSDVSTSCGYDVYWVWENPSGTSQYTKTYKANKEFTISLTDGKNSIAEMQLPDYTTTAYKLGRITSDLVEEVEANHNLNYTVRFYNLNLNQDAHAGKTYKGYLYIYNLSCGTNSNMDETLYYTIATNASHDTVNFSSTSSTSGIYTTTNTDTGNDVYYYRGSYASLNNNLIFNNMCWKIIRTTESGGIKIIYNGTATDNKCTTQTGSATQINTSAFNTNYNDNAYVGYMYGAAASSTYAATHNNTTNSTIKTAIDSWFSTNFDSTAIAKLEDTVFCNDRSTVAGGNNNTLFSSIYGTLGYNTNATGYGALNRSSYYTSTLNPSLVCANTNDKFTLKSTATNYNTGLNGNKKLDYPVGLITSDEVILSGINKNDNTTNYLYTAQAYWTISPVAYLSNETAGLSIVQSTGKISYDASNASYGIRPVVSLKASTMVTGTGSTTDPYIVQ